MDEGQEVHLHSPTKMYLDYIRMTKVRVRTEVRGMIRTLSDLGMIEYM